nr:TrkH family potassium uptake protein [Paracoccus contaminans]
MTLAAAMVIPAAHAAATGAPAIAAAFAQSAAGLLVLGVMIALATGAAGGAAPRPVPAAPPTRGVLAMLIGVYAGLPLLAAVPFAAVMQDTGLFNAWWEMLSCITTTGASLYDAGRLPASLHLWRATVGWMGGLFILVAAIAVMAPMRVGGFELMDRSAGADERFGRIEGTARSGQAAGGDHALHGGSGALRLIRWGQATAPLYAGLTGALWLLLMIAGKPSLDALVTAMGTLSTSGITMTGSPVGAVGGTGAEALVALFLLPALTRRSWPGGAELAASARLRDDPELRMSAGLVLLVTLVLFARPFAGAFSGTAQPVSTPAPVADTLTGGLARAAAAAWGSAFTALSFLTTTGWTSIDWDGARAWAGLSAPGLMLAGLAIMGGGIATTAGGVKLLRVFALGLHARRELEKIVHPASIGGGGPITRRLRGSGAYLAFVFFMVFAMSIAAVIALVSLRPVAFETATMLSVAALTNTGQLAEAIPLIPAFQGSAGIAGAPWAGWAGLSASGKAVLAAAMVAGRLETLAILALLSPGAWRR